MAARLVRGTVVAGLFALALTAGPATAASASVDELRTFTGYGYLPSDAYGDAHAQMVAYSSTCQEVDAVYSPAGSMHYWKVTLTADC
ncbi:hypothetical protein GA0074692_3848 [Micromonospora pallida]|uniref:Uncharacterized protein n=1 Tax=Micromonospora pallida TaxID=145854 RepID=A0A1C6SZ49_9ACTN|nr:hypothetical protein [Micromonospora pallida]SCL34503.1 hypothetical protein GA0074692_3848 [Micromonospora pallida]